MALRAADSAVTCAAYGVLFLLPLKPLDPALDHAMTLPAGSVIVMMVLLNVACKYALPRGTFFRSRRRTRVLPFPPLRFSDIPVRILHSPNASTHSRESARTQYHVLAFLAPTNRSPWTTPRSRVRSRALTSSWHSAPVAKTAVTSDVHQALDIHSDFTPEIALDAHLFVDDLANAVDLIVSEVSYPSVGTDIGAFENSLTRMQTNSKDVWQSGLDTLIPRKIHSRNSRHVVSPLRPCNRERLTLPLLVPWVDADHPDHALAPDDLALLAATSYRCSNFHDRVQSCLMERRYSPQNYRVSAIQSAHANNARPWRAPNTLF